MLTPRAAPGWQDGPVTESTQPAAEGSRPPEPVQEGSADPASADPAESGGPEPSSGPTAPSAEPVVVSADRLNEAIAAVRDAVRAARCVVLPTDTVYGIGADAFSAEAVQSLLDAKHRGRDMPPPVLIADPVMVDALARDLPEAARALAAAYWPGPLTLILPAHSSLRLELGHTQGTVGVRVPDHEVTRAILRATGPLAVSSANLSGQEPGTDLDSARSQLGASVAVYVDAGPTPGPVGSTIVDFAATVNGRVLRTGVISVSEIQAVAPLVEGPVEPSQPEPGSASTPEDPPAEPPAAQHSVVEVIETASTDLAAPEVEASAGDASGTSAAAG